MNIELYEGQSCNIYLTLEGEFEVYGGTTKTRFSVTKTESGVYKITIPTQTQTMCASPRYDVFARRVNTNQEWLVLTGNITLKRRYSETSGGISPLEYHITKTVLEDSMEVDGGFILVGIKGDKGDQGIQGVQGERGERGEQGIQGVKGDTGLSAYDIAKQHGYTGTEAQFTDMLIAFEAAAQKAVDAQILAEVNAINALKAAQEAKAILEEIKGVTS